MKKTMLGLAILMGCGTSDEPPAGPETLPDLTVPPPPENGFQVITPIVENLQPGMDYEICTWTDKIVDQDVQIRSTLGYQNEPPGHHAIMFYTMDKQPPNTQRVCTDTDMASFRYVAANSPNGELNEAPADLVFKIPAGAQIVMNHHYLNATENVLRGQAVMNVNFADPGTYTAVGNVAVLDTNISAPPGVSSYDLECTFDKTEKYWYVIPHMHRWGTRITVDVTRASQNMRLFDTAWDPSYTFHPPDMKLDPATPLIMNPGDKMAVHCEWDNDTAKPLTFGFEMCLAFGMTVDDQNTGSWTCNHNDWAPL